jgi:hypothetical protein
MNIEPVWSALYIGVAIILVWPLNWIFINKFYAKSRFYNFLRLAKFSFPLFGLLFILGSLTTVVINEPLRSALRSGQFRTVEGIVTDFAPGKVTRPIEDQTFKINGIEFVIPYSAVSGFGGFPGFGPQATPSLIDPTGKMLRIDYLPPNTILHIVVKE